MTEDMVCMNSYAHLIDGFKWVDHQVRSDGEEAGNNTQGTP